MEEDMIILGGESNSASYVESLIRSTQYLKQGTDLHTKLCDVIGAELDLALMDAQSAKSDRLKKSAKENVKPIK